MFDLTIRGATEIASTSQTTHINEINNNTLNTNI